MRVFPIGNGAFVAKMNISKDDLKTFGTPSQIATVVLLDRSWSMGTWVQTVVRKVFPVLFKSLGYGEDDSITILAFDDTCEVHKWSIATAQQCELNSRGGTELGPAIDRLSDYLQAVQAQGAAVRILTISDGAIFDKEVALEAADLLKKRFKGHLRINSQAIQLFSSNNAKPDTMALCSLLQMNNTKSSKVVNIYKSNTDAEFAELVKETIAGDSLDVNLQLKTRKGIFKRELWEVESLQSLNLVEGDNLFWIDASKIDGLLSGKLRISFGSAQTPVEIVQERKREEVGDVSNLLKEHFEHVYEYLKVLRIINSTSSQATMSDIVGQYRDLESQLVLAEESSALEILANNGMTSRMVYLRQELRKRDLGFSLKMSNIANDNTIDELNSAQKAEYLRSTAHSKTSRGLAKRAAISGFDFDRIARDESVAIANHLGELTKVIDDSNHQCSFYSMETTLGGIKAVASLVEEAGFEGLTANEILLIFNIVGIACEGPVGDFPDPMTWRVNKMYPGVFVSVSDLMTSKIQSGSPDSCLQVPGHDGSQITNVIPVFEDIRIAQFLRQYAPQLLSYICSIGMRGMIAHIPMTDGYTLCAGIWKLTEQIARNPTELNLNTFRHLVVSYDLFAGQYFKDSRDCLLVHRPVKDPNGALTSIYLKNNGLTNMISPMYHHLSSKEPTKVAGLKKNIPAILRGLLSYEIWQVCRREFKGAESSDKIDELLTKLLGIDFDKYAVQLPELFEKELSPDQIKLHDEPHFDYDFLMNLIDSNGWYLKYVSIMALLLEHVANGTLDTVAKPPILEECVNDEAFLKTQYGLPSDYDFKEYLMYSTVQSLLYPRMNDRVDQDNSKMIISDLIDPAQIKNKIRTYIRTKFESRHDTERVQRRKMENAELLRIFLAEIYRCTDHSDLLELLKNGVTRGHKTYRYTGFSSYGFVELKNMIFDVEKTLPLRKNLIKIFLTACDLDNGCVGIFNSGKVAVISNIDDFERVFLDNCKGTPAEWKIVFDEYRARSIHSYRDAKPNRHGHHNDKPSYWALGCPTLADYAQEHTEEEFEEYCRIHFDCCGVNQIDR